MIEARTLLAAALVVPLGMLLACLWPRALNRMPSLLAFAPIPATRSSTGCGRRVAPIPAAAAVMLVAEDSLVVGTARLHLTFALDRPGAVLLGVAALLWIASGAYASQYLQGRPNC